MKQRIRFFAAVLVVGMALSVLGGTAVFAENGTEPGADRVTIAKFDTVEAIEKVNIANKVEPSIEHTYGDSPLSLKWDLEKKGGDNVRCASPVTDWSEYQFFKMRFYASEAGMKINVMATTFDKGNVNNNPYFKIMLTAYRTGWQEVALPIKTYANEVNGFISGAKALVDGGPLVPPSWDNIGGLYINSNGWTATANIGTLYLDEIWLEKTGTDLSGGTVPEGKMLVDFNSVEALDLTQPKKEVRPSLTETRTDGNKMFALANVPKSTDFSWDIYKNAVAPINLSDYPYLNLWIYSPEIQKGGAQVIFYSGMEGSAGYKIKAVGTLNWKGWKLVSLDLSSWEGSGGTAAFDPAQIQQIKINCNGWANVSVPVWPEPGVFGIEKIWLSAAKAEDPAQLPSSGTSANFPGDNYMIKEFNQKDSITAGGTTMFSGTVGNQHLYGMSAQSNYWSSTDENRDMNLFQGAGTHNDTTGSDAIRDSKIQLGDYQYLNMWIYNPEIKYNGEKICQLNWVVMTGSAPNNSAWANGNKFTRLTMDWAGWKLVTIPIKSMLGNLADNGIWRIYLNANGWKPETISWAGKFNYIDVDCLWLSKEAPPSSFGVAENGLSVADGAKNVDVRLGGDKTYTMTFDREIANENAADLFEVYEGYTRLESGIDYSVAVEGTRVKITFAGDLEADAKYQIKVREGLRDGYGNQMPVQDSVIYSFTTEPEYTIQNLRIEGMTAKVDVKISDSAGSYPFTLVIAQSTGESLTACTVGETQNLSKKTDGGLTYTLTLPLENAAGSGTLKAMLWDDPEHMRPYVESVTAQAQQ